MTIPPPPHEHFARPSSWRPPAQRPRGFCRVQPPRCHVNHWWTRDRYVATARRRVGEISEDAWREARERSLKMSGCRERSSDVCRVQTKLEEPTRKVALCRQERDECMIIMKILFFYRFFSFLYTKECDVIFQPNKPFSFTIGIFHNVRWKIELERIFYKRRLCLLTQCLNLAAVIVRVTACCMQSHGRIRLFLFHDTIRL